MSGLSRTAFLQSYRRVNCLTEFPGSDPNQKGDAFPMVEARAAAQIHKQHLSGHRAILVGRKVAKAFGYKNAPWMQWDWCPEWKISWAVIPHPSGCNMFYNVPSNRQWLRDFLHQEILTRKSAFTLGSSRP